jgi:F0F1-type ATP synthase assembly protein I
MKEPRGPTDPNARLLADVLTFGWVLPTAMAAGAGLGYLVDRVAGSYPWATGAGGVLGVIAGFREVLRRARSFGEGPDSRG